MEMLKGVRKVVSGYAGGATVSPTYEDICTGKTGHAEVVQISFDPSEISYHDLLEVFFAIHDPTTVNRQGADVGTQYRSAIFYHSPEQHATAEEVIRELTVARVFPSPIVTQVTALNRFYPAEEYHQGYFGRNPGNPYCSAVITPKVAKLRAKYAKRLKQ